MLPSHLIRAIRILQLLQADQDLTLQEIARRIHCSQRTVYRDLDLLRQCGFRIVFRELAGGYRLERLTCLPDAPMNADELLLILSSIPGSAQAPEPDRGELFNTLAKLVTRCFPESHPLAILLIRTFLHDSAPTPLPLQHLSHAAALLFAVYQQREVELGWRERQGLRHMRLRVSNLELCDGQWMATVHVQDESGTQTARTIQIDLDQIQSIRSTHRTDVPADPGSSPPGPHRIPSSASKPWTTS